ncbi:acetylcholine receptor subunit alpha 2 [Biomphalaria glabrata]|nr:acetylcholine receptor subunit alpha 2 [Biomphalaria glabrata]
MQSGCSRHSTSLVMWAPRFSSRLGLKRLSHVIVDCLHLHLCGLGNQYPCIYLTIVMALTSVSVIMTVFVLNLHHRGPLKHSVPPWLKKLFLGSAPVKRRSFHRASDRHSNLHYSGVGGLDAHCLVKNMSLKMTLDNLAQELRDELHRENGCADSTEYSQSNAAPLSTNASCTLEEHISEVPVYNSTAMNQRLRQNERLGNDFNPLLDTNSSTPLRKTTVSGCGLESAPKGDNYAHRRLRQKTRSPYEDALFSLTKLLERHEVEEKDYDDIQDWRRLAQSVDRILFVFFLVATVSSTVAVLIIVPAMQDL